MEELFIVIEEHNKILQYIIIHSSEKKNNEIQSISRPMTRLKSVLLTSIRVFSYNITW